MNNRVFLILSFLVLLTVPSSTQAFRLWSSGCELQGDNPGVLTDMMEFGPDNQLGATSTSVKIDTSRVRSGLSSCRFNTIGQFADGPRISRVFISAATANYRITARAYVNIGTMPTTTRPKIMTFWDKGIDSHHGGIRLNPEGTLTYLDGAGESRATSTTVLTTNTWYRIELAYNDTTEVDVRIDGRSEISLPTNTGGAVDAIIFGCEEFSTSNCGADIFMDDLAVNDHFGTAQNHWPGDGSIVHLQPDSAGDSNGCSSGDVTSLDEITPDDATTICTLDADTGGDVIDVNVESPTSAGLSSNNLITLVHVGTRLAGATASAMTWNLRIKSAAGGTTQSGNSVTNSSTSYITNGAVSAGNPGGPYVLYATQDPTTLTDWTVSGTNSLENMQIGANASDGNPDVHVSTLWALVEYTTAATPAPTPVNKNIIQGGTTIRGGTTFR